MRRMLKNTTLLGTRVWLRSLVPSDFKQWKEVRTHNHNWLVPWEPSRNSNQYDPINKKSSFVNRCAAWEREWQNDRGQQFGVFVNVSQNGLDGMGKSTIQKFIGEMNISAIQRGVFQNCSLGYWVDERFAGNGYIPEAVIVASRYAFEKVGLHRVQIAIVPTNNASLRVVEKLGFRKEGISERYLEINGKWEDHCIFAMTIEEYKERKEALAAEWLMPAVNI